MILKYSDLPKSIQAIFPAEVQKYPDFKCYVRLGNTGRERYFVKFNGETTRFEYIDGRWTATKTW